MDSRTNHVSIIRSLLDALPSLLDDLRTAGYDISVSHYIAIQDLLLGLAARGERFDSFHRLQRYIGPLVCNNAAQQADFETYFYRWASRHNFALTPTHVENIEQDILEDRINSYDKEVNQVILLRSVIAVILGFVSLLLFLVFSLDIRLFDSNSPPESAVPPTENSATTFSDSTDIPSVPNIKNITTSIIFTEFGPLGTTQSSTSTQDELVRVTPADPNIVTNIPLPEIGISEPRISGIPLLFVVMMVCIISVIAWQVWWIYRLRTFLIRRMTEDEPDLMELFVKGAKQEVFAMAPLLRVAQVLRRRARIPSSEIDIERTISKTIERSGWLDFHHRNQQVLPEYLVLVDRISYRDQQAKFVDTVIDQLTQNSVLITKYYFDSIPRSFFSDEENMHLFSLHRLSSHHENFRLILFADAETLFSPITGKLEPWTEIFHTWSVRVLMTPESPSNWGLWEQELSEYFTILPATEEGLSYFAENLEGNSGMFHYNGNINFPFPTQLRVRPRRWIQDHPLDQSAIHRLVLDLRNYLGEQGYFWLGACAIYPELNWHITVYLGRTLIHNDGRPLFDSERLLALTRLPWFRHGLIPNWLRVHFISDLSSEQEKNVRSSLRVLLLTSLYSENRNFNLELAKRFNQSNAQFTRTVLNLLNQHSEQSNPFKDHVFASFLAGWWHTQIGVRLPYGLHQQLAGRPAGLTVDEAAPSSLWAFILGILIAFLLTLALLTLVNL